MSQERFIVGMIMDLNNLLNSTLEEFLLECVSNKIEDVSELPKMLKDIGYLDSKQEFIAKTTKCEILDVNDAFVENYFVSGNEIHIQYKLAFILQTFVDSEFIWRVQGCAQSKLSIPDTSLVDWSVFDTQNNKFFEYYKKYKESVHFQDTVYEEIECDTLYV